MIRRKRPLVAIRAVNRCKGFTELGRPLHTSLPIGGMQTPDWESSFARRDIRTDDFLKGMRIIDGVVTKVERVQPLALTGPVRESENAQSTQTASSGVAGKQSASSPPATSIKERLRSAYQARAQSTDESKTLR